MRIVFGQPKAPVAPLGGLLQRQCACGNHADGSECAECSKKKRTLERAARDSGGTGRQGDAAPSIVHEVLRSPGEALDSRTRAFMGEPVPAMTNWRAGLRFPLPVEIDELTGIATLHGMLIQQTQQASLDRANLMLGLVAGATAQTQPVAARTRPEKTIAVDTVKLDGSTQNPSTQVEMANAILPQCTTLHSNA
jgi:hypothetical protein